VDRQFFELSVHLSVGCLIVGIYNIIHIRKPKEEELRNAFSTMH
jgi:hypothetical protein